MVFAASRGAQKLAVAEGSTVATGERPLVLDNPDLEHRIATLTQQLAVLEAVTATHTLDARLNRNPIERRALRVATELEGRRPRGDGARAVAGPRDPCARPARRRGPEPSRC